MSALTKQIATGIVEVTNAPNGEEITIPHYLGRVPIGFEVILTDVAMDIPKTTRNNNSGWRMDETKISITVPVASATFRMRFF